MGKINWTAKAENHLNAIHSYVARDSQLYATRFIKSLIHATHKLQLFPLCGRIVPEFSNDNIREVIYQNYRIVYRLLELKNDIEILAVIHIARELTTVLRNEWELN